MRFRGPLRAAAACALMLMGGCDYWTNLVEQKTVAYADLTVFARDAWTGEVLPDAVCSDSASHTDLASNNAGTHWLAVTATGHYSIRCTDPLYYPAEAEVDLPPDGKAVTVKFARRGGEEWYLDYDRRVRIPDIPDSLRFPADLDWLVTPTDEKGAFRYEWTFSHASGLNRGHPEGHGQVAKNGFYPRYQIRATSDEGVKAGTDSVKLKVYSRLNGAKNEYLVDSAEAEINWVRNRKPSIKLDSGGYVPDTRVGCGDEVKFIHPRVQAKDSDATGACSMIHLWTKDKESSLRIDTTLTCAEKLFPAVQLYVPNRGGEPRQDGSQIFESILFAEVTDDNGETARDTLVVKTHTNAPPKAVARIVDPKPGYYIDDIIQFELTANDTDGHFNDLGFIWDWDNFGKAGSFTMHPEDPPEPSDTLITKASFDHADSLSVTSFAHDECGRDAFPKSFKMLIEADSSPVISYTKPDTARKGDSLRISFDLSITDHEVSLDKDYYSKIRITWDDKREQTDSTRIGERYPGRTMVQMYPYPAAGERFTVKIHVEDAHHKKADASFQVP